MSDIKEAYSILFVEDEKDIRDNYVKYLSRHFASVYEAGDGLQGLQQYEEHRPDIMIVDINLPNLNGLDMVKKIRENDHATKVIMLTAHSETNYLLQATELKLTKYLIKPISRSDLKDALALVVDELSKFDVSSKKIITLKDAFYWDIKREELLEAKNAVVLTNKERAILKVLFSKPNTIFSYDDIIFDVWYGYDHNSDKLDALKTIIKNLRKKLPKDSLKNVFGIGYKINLD